MTLDSDPRSRQQQLLMKCRSGLYSPKLDRRRERRPRVGQRYDSRPLTAWNCSNGCMQRGVEGHRILVVQGERNRKTLVDQSQGFVVNRKRCR
jgi:hypothetical protein